MRRHLPRGILATREIRRISGYPANEIRAVTRRQGARTDLAFPPTRPTGAITLADAASAIVDTSDPERRMRIFFEFIRDADEAGPHAPPLVTSEPAATGDQRIDALLAAAAASPGRHRGLAASAWEIAIKTRLGRLDANNCCRPGRTCSPTWRQ